MNLKLERIKKKVKEKGLKMLQVEELREYELYLIEEILTDQKFFVDDPILKKLKDKVTRELEKRLRAKG